MDVGTVAELIDGTVITGGTRDYDVEYGFASDLMSDVLTLTADHGLFITGLVAPQTIRTAVVSDINVILFVRGKSVPESIVTLAEENEIVVITTARSMFRASGELYAAGLKPAF